MLLVVDIAVDPRWFFMLMYFSMEFFLDLVDVLAVLLLDLLR